jgi:hypothetical protein
MSDPVKANIVFLHIPKTAGQTIHTALCNAVGPEAVSPIRVHTQVADGPSQFPPGYRLYSGHLDWEAIERVPKPRFVFTVLRDPLERLASFYFYIRRQAERISLDELAKPNRIGRGGSVDLNRFRAFSKWFSASVTPLPLLASAG